MIDLVEIIASIEADNESRGVAPSHAMLTEIIAEVDKRIRPELRQLCQDGKLDWCETLNSYAFSIKKDK